MSGERTDGGMEDGWRMDVGWMDGSMDWWMDGNNDYINRR